MNPVSMFHLYVKGAVTQILNDHSMRAGVFLSVALNNYSSLPCKKLVISLQELFILIVLKH
jgi:hypothetical protein